MKYSKYLFASFIAIMLMPIVAKAEDITVLVKSNPANAQTVCELTAEKNVTTVNDLKALLVSDCNLDLSNYMVAVSGYDQASGYEVVCTDFSCWGPINSLQTNLYVYPIDHTEKNYTIKSIPPANENIAESIFETNYELFEPLGFKSCNSTFDVCTFMDYQNAIVYDNVVINYQYDKAIAVLAQALVDAGLLNKTDFKMTDTELLHYFNYGGSFVNYASEFKNQLSNLNFSFEMDQRGGSADPFETGAIGFYRFMYDDVLYAVKDFMSVTGEHVVYVPTDTTDIKTALENRLKDLFVNEVYLSVSESDETINELLDSMGENPITGGDSHYFILTNTNENSPYYGREYFIIVKKDSSKINNNVVFKSSDLVTKVAVATDEKIPLDTLVKVKQLVSGETYESILKSLNITDGEMFDISLKSISQNKMITKLDNGKFKVSIPIPDKFKDKENLIVYYVDADGNITAYSVKPENGYATFETDHFSIYTLAEGASEEKVIKNPPTLDNIYIYFGILMVSAIGLNISLKRKIN